MNDWKEIGPFWSLSDTFTVNEAAALIAGFDPHAVDHHGECFKDVETGLTDGDGIRDLMTVRTALNKAVNANTLQTAWVATDHSGKYEVPMIDREDLIAWLRSRGHTTGFFFPEVVSKAPDYLNPNLPKGYAPRLAAAVNAWLAVQAMSDTKGKTVKQTLLKWLRENAATYGLTDDDGKVNETGIEEVAKVANWEPKGGAPKTPG